MSVAVLSSSVLAPGSKVVVDPDSGSFEIVHEVFPEYFEVRTDQDKLYYLKSDFSFKRGFWVPNSGKVRGYPRPPKALEKVAATTVDPRWVALVSKKGETTASLRVKVNATTEKQARVRCVSVIAKKLGKKEDTIRSLFQIRSIVKES